MKFTEETAHFDCAGDAMSGILTCPETPCSLGVVVVVGGPQYRVGSHRQFVLLSRSLAAAGYAVLRFDYRGMGDSEGLPRDFLNVSADIAAAIDLLQARTPQVKKVALWGLCDGASAALLYCFDTRDLRVSHLFLLNPWVRNEASLARTHIRHYYLQRLMQRDFWSKASRGGVAWKALSALLRNLLITLTSSTQRMIRPLLKPRMNLDSLSYQQRMALAWQNFEGSICLMLSSDDYTAKEFMEHASTHADWQTAMQRSCWVRHDLAGCDHTCSSDASRTQVEQLTLAGLARDTAQTSPIARYENTSGPLEKLPCIGSASGSPSDDRLGPA